MELLYSITFFVILIWGFLRIIGIKIDPIESLKKLYYNGRKNLSTIEFRFIDDDRELQRHHGDNDGVVDWPPIYASRTNLPFSEIAERIVVDALTDIVKDEHHHIMQNLTLPLENGGSSQIDVVLVSRRGVFVIEVKAFRGIITGNAEDEYWTQSRGFDIREFKNPLRQNHSHLLALKECIGIPMEIMHSLVIFGREGRFKAPISDNVIHLDKLRDIIQNEAPNKLNERELIDLIGKTELLRLPQCMETDNKHVEYVKNKSAAAG